MIEYLILGATYAFAAAVQPGQFQAYLISQAIARGWRRTLPAALAPVISDLPIICLALLVLTQVPPTFASLLRFAGGGYLLSLAWGAAWAWHDYRHALGTPRGGGYRTVLQAALVNILNPNPYLGWTLVLGPLLLQAWSTSAGHAAAFIVTFYATMALGNAVIIVMFASARSFGPGVARALLGVSAVALACFGLYQIWAGALAILMPQP